MSHVVLGRASENVGFASPRSRAAEWLRLGLEAFGRHDQVKAGQVLCRFAETLAEALSPKVVAEALVRVAHEVSGAPRVELLRERCWNASRIAAWPRSDEAPKPTASTSASAFAGRGRSITLSHPGAEFPRLDGRASTLTIPARSAGRAIATLRLYSDQPRHWPSEMVRLLSTLTSLAASSGFAPEETLEPVTTPSLDMATSLPNAAFLEAFLNFAVAQAQRKHEPLSVLCIGVDRLAAIRGPRDEGEPSTDADRLVGWTVAATLRASDLVARFDDGRLVAVLPNARFDDALLIAETVREAIDKTGRPSDSLPFLTAKIGVVGYPEHGREPGQLIYSASKALVEAQAAGPIFGPPILPGLSLLKMAQCVG